MAQKNKDKAHYVDRKEFYNSLVIHFAECKLAKEQGLPKPRVTNYIGECFMKIAEGLSHQSKFIGYTFREDMVSDAVENCLRYYHNFNTEKYDNPFAYFTQISKFAFYRRIAKEKKELYTKYKSTEMWGVLGENPMSGDGAIYDSDSGGSGQFELYDNLSEFIATYEESRKRKSEEKKIKGIEKFLDEEPYIEMELREDDEE